LQFNKRQFYFALYNYVALVNQNTLAGHQFSKSAHQLIQAERGSLKQVKIIFDRYIAESLAVVDLYNKMDETGKAGPLKTIQEIDKAIKINDKPAVDAMRNLQVGISQLRAEVLNHSHQLVETLNILIIMSSVILAVFICTAITFSFQLLRPIIKLQKLISETGCTTTAINRIHYPHSDEIGQLFEDIKRNVMVVPKQE
jgi:methyl-accepting chemotaxis protein